MAANDQRNPPNVGIIVGKAPSHRIATLTEGIMETEMYIVAWPVAGQLAYAQAPGVNLRVASRQEVDAVITQLDQAKSRRPNKPS